MFIVWNKNEMWQIMLWRVNYLYYEKGYPTQRYLQFSTNIFIFCENINKGYSGFYKGECHFVYNKWIKKVIFFRFKEDIRASLDSRLILPLNLTIANMG